MLWLPGVWAIYGNGIELARWESARVSNVPAHIFFYMVSGGGLMSRSMMTNCRMNFR
jgi:hypothetical protein